jgi:hypothetical protein
MFRGSYIVNKSSNPEEKKKHLFFGELKVVIMSNILFCDLDKHHKLQFVSRLPLPPTSITKLSEEIKFFQREFINEIFFQ